LKVVAKGFSVQAGNSHVSVDDVLSWMEGSSGAPDLTKGLERRIYVSAGEGQGFARGLVVTVRDQKKFLRMAGDGQNVVIEVENLRGDQHLMEFNFFVLNRANGLGLYLHYHQSCSIAIFGSFLQGRYHTLSRSGREAAEAALGDDASARVVRDLRKEFAGKLVFAQLVSRQGLEDILKECKSIESFEYEFATVEQAKATPATPLSRFAKRRREKITFVSKSPVAALAKAVAEALGVVAPKSGKVLATTVEGKHISLKISDIPEHFAEYEYDEIAGRLDKLNTAEFASHPILDEMEHICRSEDNRATFMAEFKE